MFSRLRVVAFLLVFLLSCSLAISQQPTNLSIPANHTATGTAIGHNPTGETGYCVRLFNAKDQPSLSTLPIATRRAYWYAPTVHQEVGEVYMHDAQLTWLLPSVYPSVVTRGGVIEDGVWNEAVVAGYDAHRYAGSHAGNNWLWDDRNSSAAPVICGTTQHWTTR